VLKNFQLELGLLPPQRISVNKIRIGGVKKSGLFERSEFLDFSQLNLFLGNYLQRRPFLLTFWGCSQKVRARAAVALN